MDERNHVNWEGTERVIGALIEVHRHLGPGLLESIYERALCRELELREIPYQRQRGVPLVYKGVRLEVGLRCDLVIDSSIIVELKAVESVLPIHTAQVISYLRLTGLSVGLLVNFNVRTLKSGIRRLWLDETSRAFRDPTATSEDGDT